MNDLLIHNGNVVLVPERRVLANGAILIESGRIVAIGRTNKIKRLMAGHDRLDADGNLILPGLINAHTHLPEVLLRGLCDDAPLERWLKVVIDTEHRLTPALAHAGAMLGCVELIKNGITCFIDQYFFAASIADAVIKTGLRGVLCPSIYDNCPEGKSIENQFKIAVQNVKRLKDRNSRLIIGLGPHAPYSVNEEWWFKVRDFATKYNLLVHTHLSETADEIEEAKRRWGVTPIQYLEKIGILKCQMLAAHCVWVTARDIQLLRKNNVRILHCPQSNLKTSAGIAPVAQMLASGINVSIGTDGAASNNNLDLLEETRTASMLQKHLFSADAMNIWQALECITVNPARAARLEKRIGTLEVGKEADIVILNTKQPHLCPQKSPLSNLIYSASGSDVETVICAGRLIMENRKILSVNEDRVLEMAARAADKLW